MHARFFLVKQRGQISARADLTVTSKTESTLELIIKNFLYFLRYFRGFRVDIRVLSVLTTNPDRSDSARPHRIDHAQRAQSDDWYLAHNKIRGRANALIKERRNQDKKEKERRS